MHRTLSVFHTRLTSDVSPPLPLSQSPARGALRNGPSAVQEPCGERAPAGAPRPRGQRGAGPGGNRACRAGRRPALPRRPSAGVAGRAGQGATLGGRAPGSRGHSRVAVRFPSVLAAGAGWDRGVAQLVLCVPRCLSGGLSRLGTAGQVTQTRGQGPRGQSAGLASGTCFPA